MQRLRSLAALALIGATACSSHGGAAVTPPTAPVGGGVTTSGTQAKLTVIVPQAGTTTSSTSVRRPQYVSPSSTNLVVAVNGGTPTTYGLTPQSPGCVVQVGNVTCTFGVVAPAGQDALALTLTDGTGKVLSQNVVTATIAAGAATPVAVTLAGVPTSVAVVPGAGARIDGTSAPYHFPGLFAQPVEVEPLDADGNVIIGPGAPTITNVAVTTGSAYAGVTSAKTTDPAAYVLRPVDGTAGGQTVTVSATVQGVPLSDGTTSAPVTGTTNYTFTPALMTASGAFITVYSIETQNPVAQFKACPGLCTLTIVDDATTDGKGGIYLLYHQIAGLQVASTLSVYPPGATAPSYALGSAAGVNGATGITVDKNGTIYVANATSGFFPHRTASSIEEFAPGATTATTKITGTPAQPGGIAVDPQGNVYVADKTGAVDVYAPGGTTPSETLSDPSLGSPSRLALDASGGLYVNDATNDDIAYFAAGQTALTSTLSDGSFGITPGAPIMIDPSGNLWYSLTGNNVIERLSASALPNSVSFLPQFNAGGAMGWIP
ncbi:MAG TPA: hypothetical protein VMA36_05410 [Candidatus Limnocylindria bacterium]|nr:hypothetical protein [Candidatus Limnocylindria bacterium]